MTTNSLQAAEDLIAKGAAAPRVSLASMEGRIVEKHFFTVGEVLTVLSDADDYGMSAPAKGSPLHLLTLCVLVLDNGWVTTGKSAPASPENFDAETGRVFAYEDAVRQLWPLEGYLLRERLWIGQRALASDVDAD